MRRLPVLLALAMPTGCQPPVASESVSLAPASAASQAPIPGISAEIDFANWPTVTEWPIMIRPPMAVACSPGLNSPAARWAQTGGEKRHGPHHDHWIIVRTNPSAMEAFRTGTATMPVGTTVIKEKHTDLPLKNPPLTEYGAMIKRESGYDPAHGDWEYLYVTLKPEKKVARGRLESCIDCHSHAKDKDYLFRTYLPGKAAEVSGW